MRAQDSSASDVEGTKRNTRPPVRVLLFKLLTSVQQNERTNERTNKQSPGNACFLCPPPVQPLQQTEGTLLVSLSLSLTCSLTPLEPHLRGHLVAKRDPMGSLGSSWSLAGALLGPLGGVLAFLGPSWGPLGTPWGGPGGGPEGVLGASSGGLELS